MTDFFKESDCDVRTQSPFEPNEFGGGCILLNKSISLSRANALLRERSTAVYGHYDGKTFWANDPKLGLRSGMTTPDTHTALLISITPPEVDSAEKIVADLVKWYSEPATNPPIDKWVERARKLTKGE